MQEKVLGGFSKNAKRRRLHDVSSTLLRDRGFLVFPLLSSSGVGFRHFASMACLLPPSPEPTINYLRFKRTITRVGFMNVYQ